MNLWLHSRHTSTNEGNDTYLMSNMCYLTVTLIFGGYLVITGRYWWLLLVTACYCSFPVLVWTEKKMLKIFTSHLKITWYSKKQKKNIGKRERNKKNKKKSNNRKKKLYIKIYILLENKFGKTYSVIAWHIAWHFIGNAIIKHQRPIDMHWSCRRRNLTKNNWQQTRYFNLDGLLFYYFSNKCKENFWFTPYM